MGHGGVGRRIARVLLGGAVLAGSLALGSGASDAQSADWSIVRLAPLPGDNGSTVQDVNNDGIAVGYSTGGFTPNGLETTPVVWSANGTPTALPEPVSGMGKALAINDEGEIVGEVITAASIGLGATTAVLWTPTESGYAATSLGNGSARDINDSGVIVGATSSLAGPPFINAALFSPGQPPAPLPPVTGYSSADRVNAGGVAIGSQAEEPVAWAAGTQHHLYQVLDAFDVQVKDVTDAYYTMGWLIVDDRPLAFLQAPGGAIFPLTGDPTRSSAATDLNNIGIAVGAAGDGEGGADAALFVYGAVVPIESLLSAEDDVAWDLSPLVQALNDDVWVVGNGRRGSESGSGWLLRPPQ